MKELQQLQNEIKKWSDRTFGSDFDRREGMAAHLRKEVAELQGEIVWNNKLGIQVELADCLMLILDIASHSGIDIDSLIFEVEHKLQINKLRKWGKTNPDGSIEHIKN